jgi:hypothetical protein
VIHFLEKLAALLSPRQKRHVNRFHWPKV